MLGERLLMEDLVLSQMVLRYNIRVLLLEWYIIFIQDAADRAKKMLYWDVINGVRLLHHMYTTCILPSIYLLAFYLSICVFIHPFTSYLSIFRYLVELGQVIHMLMTSYVMQCLLILYFLLHLLMMWKMSVFSMKHLIVN